MRMMVRLLLALLFALHLRLAGAAEDASPAPNVTETPSLGERLFHSRCEVCHGEAVVTQLSEALVARKGLDALDAHLAEHHAADDEARQEIMSYLERTLFNDPQE